MKNELLLNSWYHKLPIKERLELLLNSWKDKLSTKGKTGVITKLMVAQITHK
jgi:hypothetical protein